MNARAEIMQPSSAALTSIGRAEHISLETTTDLHQLAAAPARRNVRAKFALSSKLRACSTELSILEDHFLRVRSIRAGSETKYELDLRFANAKPVLVRRIAWAWLATTVAMIATSGGSMAWAASSAQNFWISGGFLAGIGALLGAAVTALIFWRNTTESLEFTSVHGGATLVSITGGIGSGKAGKAFFIELIKNINSARLARPQPQQQFLRDEMREHHRLYQLGALSEEAYEAGKKRILKAHS